MKFIIDNWMLIAVALASGGMLLWPVIQGVTSGDLDQFKDPAHTIILDPPALKSGNAVPYGG